MAVRTGLTPRRPWLIAIALVAFGLTGCLTAPATPTAPLETLSFEMSTPVPTSDPTDGPAPIIATAIPSSCEPTDQDQYVSCESLP